MTLEEAKDVLGFPPGSSPSDAEINKAWKSKAKEHHPDRGGSPTMMVEINVAKEVLEGKRVNDRTEVGTDTSQRRIDLATIKEAKQRATTAFERTVREISHLYLSWRVDLREYLKDDFADTVDELHDFAELAVKTTTGKRQRRMQDIVRGSKAVLEQASRASSKLKGLSKRTTAAKKLISVVGLTSLCVEFGKYMDVYKELDKESGRLNELLALSVSSDDDAAVVPSRLEDAVFKCRDIIDSFRDFYAQFSTDCDVKGISATVEDAVEQVLEVLRSRKVALASLPHWDEWDASTFEHAATLIDRRTNASRRVAARYLETS
jgi:hypothetical protein